MMKKPILPLLLLFISFQLHSQSFLGVYGGLNSGKFSGDTPRDFVYAAKMSYTIGLGYDQRIKDDVYITFAPGFLNAASKLQYPKENEIEETIEYEDSIHFDFQLVSLPIMLKLISDNKRFQFSSGFEFLIPLKLMADNGEESEDIIDGVNKLNLNLLFGVGYRIPIKKQYLIINLCYAQGLTNLANNVDSPDSLLPRVRYNTFRLTANWALPVGKKNQQSEN